MSFGGGGPDLPAVKPQPRPPTRQDPEIEVSRQEITEREKRRKGRAASNVPGNGFLESANIFTPTLKDTTG